MVQQALSFRKDVTSYFRMLIAAPCLNALIENDHRLSTTLANRIGLLFPVSVTITRELSGMRTDLLLLYLSLRIDKRKQDEKDLRAARPNHHVWFSGSQLPQN